MLKRYLLAPFTVYTALCASDAQRIDHITHEEELRVNKRLDDLFQRIINDLENGAISQERAERILRSWQQLMAKAEREEQQYHRYGK